jgi:hypothetical protein
MNLDFIQTETPIKNSDYFDKTKISIIRHYFIDKNITNYNEVSINIYFKDNRILKRLSFPKTIFRTYTIGLKDGINIYQVPITHKEKDILKELIIQMNHDVYYNG